MNAEPRTARGRPWVFGAPIHQYENLPFPPGPGDGGLGAAWHPRHRCAGAPRAGSDHHQYRSPYLAPVEGTQGQTDSEKPNAASPSGAVRSMAPVRGEPLKSELLKPGENAPGLAVPTRLRRQQRRRRRHVRADHARWSRICFRISANGWMCLRAGVRGLLRPAFARCRAGSPPRRGGTPSLPEAAGIAAPACTQR